jgi:hypothetical protein
MKSEYEEIPQDHRQKEIQERSHDALPQELPRIANCTIGRIRWGVFKNVLRITRGKLIQTRINSGEEVGFGAKEQL